MKKVLKRWQSSGFDGGGAALTFWFSPTNACKRVEGCRRGTRASRNEKSDSAIHDFILTLIHSELPHRTYRMNECNLQVFQHLALTNGITSFAFHGLTFWNDSCCFVSLFWCFFLVFSQVLLPELWVFCPKKFTNIKNGRGGCRPLAPPGP